MALGVGLPGGERGHIAAAAASAEHIGKAAYPACAGRVVIVVVDRAEGNQGRRAERGLRGHPHRVGLAASRAGDGINKDVIAQIKTAHGGALAAHGGAVAGDRLCAEHVDAVEIDLLARATEHSDAYRVKAEAGGAEAVTGDTPQSVIYDRVAEVASAGGQKDAERAELRGILVIDVVDPVLRDLRVVIGRSKLDAGNVGAYGRGELVEDFVLGDYRCQCAD